MRKIDIRSRLGSLGRVALAAASVAVIGIGPVLTTSTVAHAATEGGLDTTFNPGGAGANKAVRAMAFAADGKIYIGGDFTSYNGTPVNAFARLNKDGTLDTTFNAGGAGFTKLDARVLSIHVDTDGDVYVAGDFARNNQNEPMDAAEYNRTALTTNVVRLNSDGSLDSDFVPMEIKSSSTPTDDSATITLVKKIGDVVFVSGSFNEVYENGLSGALTPAKGIVGLTVAGSLDPNFGAQVILTDQTQNSVKRALQIHSIPNSTDIYLVGDFTYVQTRTEASDAIPARNVIRVSSDGSRVTTYANKSNENVGPNGGSVEASLITSDGKLILSGDFTTFNGVAKPGLVRVNSDGTLDASFTSPAGAFFSPKLAADSAGRMYVTGTMLNFAAENKNLVRLKSDGSLDAEFSLESQPNYFSISTAVAPDGRVFVIYFPDSSQLSSGGVTKYGDTQVGFIARINVKVESGGGSSGSTDKPGSPTDIRVKISGTQARVSWKAPTTGGTPTSYTATARSAGKVSASVSTAKSLTCTATAPATTCTIKGLKVGTKYTFAVTALNDAGTSELLELKKSVAVTSSTPEAANTLPATGSSQSSLVVALVATMLMAGGLGLRRLRRL